MNVPRFAAVVCIAVFACMTLGLVMDSFQPGSVRLIALALGVAGLAAAAALGLGNPSGKGAAMLIGIVYLALAVLVLVGTLDVTTNGAADSTWLVMFAAVLAGLGVLFGLAA